MQLSNRLPQFKLNRRLLAAAITASVAHTGHTATIEEVLVTAQKREQSAQDIPMTISAFSGSFIDSAQITDAKELALLTPGVAGNSDDSFLDTINIRGISTNDFGVGAEPSVGVYQNGIYLGRTGGALSSFFDIDRVEVIKGPQGTLFGRNASAGAITVHTNRPTDEQGGSAEVGVGQDGYTEMTVVANLPINDEWSSRMALYRETKDGWVENSINGQTVGELEVSAARFTVQHQNDLVTSVLTVEHEDRLLPPSLYQSFDPEQLDFDFLTNLSSAEDSFESDLDSDQLFDEGQVWGTTLDVTVDLGDGYTLNSLTGIRGHDYHYREDFDGNRAEVFSFEQLQEQDYYSQEFRINYDGNGPVSWFVGASLYKEDLKTRYNQTFDEDVMCGSWGQAYTGYDPEYVTDCASYYNYYNFVNYYAEDYASYEEFADGDDFVEYDPGIGMRNDATDVDADYEGWGIYGDATWEATEQLTLTAGTRYTVDKRDFSVSHNGYNAEGYPGFYYGFPYFTSEPVTASEEWSNLSWRFAANYQFNDDVMLYGNLSTGYKAGGFNTFFLEFAEGVDPLDLATSCDELASGCGDEDLPDASTAGLGAKPEQFEEEEVLNMEFGFKATLLDGAMQLNGNIYRYEFDNMQVGAYRDGSVYILSNVGDAEGQGIEFDMRWLPTDQLDIYLAMGWADSELTRAAADFCDLVDCDEGAELSGTVDFSGALVATYRWPLNHGDLAFTWETFHQGDSPGFGEFNDDPLILESFTTSNIRLGYESGDNWQASLWVSNVTDEFYFKGITGREGNIAAHRFGYAEPRRVGVRFSVDF
ncbi:MAG: TonB-dependent receptor [Porticoccaceae bacterium]